MEQKPCTKCGKTLPTTSFFRSSTAKDGLQCHCKECQYEHRRTHGRPPISPATKAHRNRTGRERYYRNRERNLALAREWQRNNRDKVVQYSINCNGRRRAQQRDGIPITDLRKWREAQPNTCYWCGARNLKRTTIDHYIPLSRGGKHEIGNLVIACKSCNSSKHAKDPLEFARERGRLL